MLSECHPAAVGMRRGAGQRGVAGVARGIEPHWLRSCTPPLLCPPLLRLSLTKSQRGGAWQESGCPWTDANITFTQLGGLQSVSASGWHYAKKPSAEREDVGGSVTSATRGPSVTASDGERGPIRFYSHPVRKTSAGGLRKWVKRRDVAGVPVAGLNMDHLSPLCVRLKGQSRQAPAGESASCGSVLKVHLLPGLTPPGLQRAAEHNQEICTKGISITGTILQVSSGIQGDLF